MVVRLLYMRVFGYPKKINLNSRVYIALLCCFKTRINVRFYKHVPGAIRHLTCLTFMTVIGLLDVPYDRKTYFLTDIRTVYEIHVK